MFDVLKGSILGAWLNGQARRNEEGAKPRGGLQVHATGPDADRVLLVVDRPSVGDGILSQELGLAGHLARQLSLMSGRGTDIDVLANGNMTAHECAVALDAIDLARFDSIVLLIGLSEALTLTSPRRWSSRLNRLLDQVDKQLPHRSHMFVVAIPPVRALVDFPKPFEVVVQARIDRLNAATEAASRPRPNVSVLPFPLAAATGGRNSSETFKIWAGFIAPAVREQLDATAATSRPPLVSDESARQQSLDDLHIIDNAPNAQVDSIVESARSLFGTAAAAVTFLDHDRRWVKSAIGTATADSPRAGSLCDLAIQAQGVFIIEDFDRSQFRADGRIRRSLTKFYAGFPIESPGGRRIGVLCLMDDKPRRFSRSDASLLRELALRVQAEVWNADQYSA
jgi:hypothetical protein